jgi:hypothetical protein
MLRPYHLNPQHLNTSTPFTSAIQKANTENTITILNETRLIVDWLTWRREVAPEQQRYLNEMTSKINSMRQQAIRQGVGVSDNGWFFVGLSSTSMNASWLKKLKIWRCLGTLDGQLSLKNATITIDL